MMDSTSSFLENLREDFEKLLKKDKLSHAYLFFGGSERCREDKFNFAESLANFLEKGKFERPRRLLQELMIVKREEEVTIGIDKIRLIKNFLYQKPIFSKYRTVIIEEAEVLTPEAQSAILKIAEEPPEAGLIILIAKNENSLFLTLASRLQKIYFPAAAVIGRESGWARWKEMSLNEVIENDRIDEFFESLLADLSEEPIKNFQSLKQALRRLALIKQFNTNKKLQLRVLGMLLRDSAIR